MQTSQGGFTVLNAPSSTAGGMYPGLTPQQNSFFNNWGQNTIYDEMALGLQPQNAPKQSGVQQGIDLAKNVKDISDLTQSSEGSSLLGDLFKSGKNTTDTATSFGLNNAINKLGVDIGFGAAKGAPVIGGVGPTNVAQTGTLGLQGTLGQTLGGAGLGYLAGGYIGKLVGGNEKNAAIGGAAGGALGAAVLGSSLSTGLGAALGTIGSVIPGVGTVIGAVAGSLLGSMFGKKKKHASGAVWDSSISETGQVNQGGYFGGKHVSASSFTPTINDFSSYLQKQVKNYGIKPSSDVRVGVGYDVSGYSSAERAQGAPGFQSGTDVISVYSRSKVPSESLYARNTIGSDYKMFYYNSNDEKSKKAAYEAAARHVATLSGQDYDALKTAKKSSTTMPALNVQANASESPFDKFLREYREKQNANLA